jgi:hypothetical protein
VSATDLDLGPPVRASILADAAIVALLGKWKQEPSIFTRRPVPSAAADPMVIINPPASLVDAGTSLVKDTPVVVFDIAIYGHKGAPGSSDDQTRKVEEVGFLMRELFHRDRWALSVDGFHVIDVRATGPFRAPVDDDQTVGRIVTLTVSLRREA